MSILDNLPHTCSARIRTRVKDTLGGTKDSFSTTVFTDRSCWRQSASDSEMSKWEKRGIEASNKVFFTSDPGLDERHVLEFTDDGTVYYYEVVNRPLPDSSAGLGIVWRVLCRRQPSGGRS